MSSNLNFWMNEVNRINNAKHDIANVIRNKGVDVPESAKLEDYHHYINHIHTYDANNVIASYNGDNMIGFKYSSTGIFDNAFSNYVGEITNIFIGENSTNIRFAYSNCRNLTCNPVCGDNVTDMSSAYRNCTNLTGHAICGTNVTNMSYAYQNCRNITGNVYLYSNDVSNICGCFNNKKSTILNIYVLTNSTTLNTCLISNRMSSIINSQINWTDNYATNGMYYNTRYNIYIYPVDNVIQARINNND